MKIKIEEKPYEIIYVYEGSVIIDNIPYCFELKSGNYELDVYWLEELPENIENSLLEDEILEKYKSRFL